MAVATFFVFVSQKENTKEAYILITDAEIMFIRFHRSQFMDSL